MIAPVCKKRFLCAYVYYAFALLAVFMVAQPWRVRDFAEKVAQQELTIKKMAFPALSMALLAFIPTVLFYV